MRRGLAMLRRGMRQLQTDLGETFDYLGKSVVGIVGEPIAAGEEEFNAEQGPVWLVPVRFARADFVGLPRIGQTMTNARFGTMTISTATVVQDAVTVVFRLPLPS